MDAELLDELSTPQAIAFSGFLLGFMSEFKFNKSTLENPLTTILEAGFSGIITSLGAVMVGAFIPPGFRFIIPVTSIVACIHYKLKELAE
jgi:hypothetical protein